MVEETENLVLEMLKIIRADQVEMSAKISTMAQSMVSMRKDISNLEVKICGLEVRINKLDDSVQGVRADVRMIAIAVDEHTNRLDKIEAHYNPPSVKS